MTFSLELAPHLFPDETLLWVGEPHQGIRWLEDDWYVAPMALAWLVASAYSVYSAFFMADWLKWLSLCIGLPCLFFGIYIFVARWIFNTIIRDNTTYGITNQRILIKTGLFNKNIYSIGLQECKNVQFLEKGDSSGMITFSADLEKHPQGNAFVNLYPIQTLTYFDRLEITTDVKEVFLLLNQAKKEIALNELKAEN